MSYLPTYLHGCSGSGSDGPALVAVVNTACRALRGCGGRGWTRTVELNAIEVRVAPDAKAQLTGGTKGLRRASAPPNQKPVSSPARNLPFRESRHSPARAKTVKQGLVHEWRGDAKRHSPNDFNPIPPNHPITREGEA